MTFLKKKINLPPLAELFPFKFFSNLGRQDSLVDKALDSRPKGTGFDPRLDHKRHSTSATNSFSM
jgi:hypothetical protein